MPNDSDVATRLPARDLERARAFYAGKLGLEPVEKRPGGLRYRCGAGSFVLFVSTGVASGDHTAPFRWVSVRCAISIVRAVTSSAECIGTSWPAPRDHFNPRIRHHPCEAVGDGAGVVSRAMFTEQQLCRCPATVATVRASRYLVASSASTRFPRRRRTYSPVTPVVLGTIRREQPG
jgi:catechol 2,3-dioxygenase-like lactoylglutathione lyase family enzyme